MKKMLKVDPGDSLVDSMERASIRTGDPEEARASNDQEAKVRRDTWGQCFETLYGRNLRIFVIN